MKDDKWFLTQIRVDENLRKPKYLQIVNSIIQMVRVQDLPIGHKLPSINLIAQEFLISRETVVKAYKYLRARGLINSQHGKGYFISSNQIAVENNVCLIFNRLSKHKKVLHDAFREELGDSGTVDLFIYNNNLGTLENFIDSKSGLYSHYLIVPHLHGLSIEMSRILDRLPYDQILMLDRDVQGINKKYQAIYQNFKSDVEMALSELGGRLLQYHQFNLIWPHGTLHPPSIRDAFVEYCTENDLKYAMLDRFEPMPEVKAAYLIMDDEALVDLLRYSRNNEMTLGVDLGVITYNDNPLKEFIDKGITVISPDFEQMGKTAAKMVMQSSFSRTENPCVVVIRGSL